MSVLGSILLSEQALDGILIDVKLRAADFYLPRHGVIFGAMIRLKEKADPEPVDVLTVSDELDRSGQLEEVGGREYVHSLPNLVPAAANARQYARIVKEYAMLRRLLETTRGIQDDVFGFAGEPRELLEKAEAQLYRIAHDDHTGELRSIESILHDELAKLERVSREGVAITGTPSGFKDIDDLTGGFQPGNLIVLAARPAMGKCLAGSTLVYDPSTGGRRRIDDLVAAHERGEEIWVASLGEDEQLRPAQVGHVARNGPKPIFRLTTLLGRQLDATANHPLRVSDGWRRLDELSTSDRVAAATRLPPRMASNRELVGVAGGDGAEFYSHVPPEPIGPNIEWDEVVAIEALGVEETYDVSVPDGHNFVANGLVVHNSALATNIAQNASVDHERAIALFSLEMSETELAQRFIAAEAKLNGDDLRKGRVRPDRWPKVVKATEKLHAAPLYIDDSSDLGVMEMRAKARRLHAREPLGLVIVDYLQLMRPEPGADSRVEQIGQISRGLKLLARELNIPVIAVSQLSRAVEQRPDKRPLLSDLRESGCLTGDSLVYLPDSGRHCPIRDLDGADGVTVLAVNADTWKLERRTARGFRTGRKPVYRITTNLGRTVRATGNHKFLTVSGWRRLDELELSEHIAVPRRLPGPQEASMSEPELALLGHLIGDGCTLPRHAIQYTTKELVLAEEVARLATEVFGDAVSPRIKSERTWYQVYLAATRHLTHRVRNPVAAWLDELGAFGARAESKRIPARVFAQPAGRIALFLRHLWSTDGCIWAGSGARAKEAIYYATSSAGLARDVQQLLLRLEINATVHRVGQAGKGRDQFHVTISGAEDSIKFVEAVGGLGGPRSRRAAEVLRRISGRRANTNRDVIPRRAWREIVVPAMAEAGLTTRQLQAGIGLAYCGSTLFKANIGRERAARVASVSRSTRLDRLSTSDVYWDQIRSIQPDGVEDVYDLTVDGLHNFVADGIVVHNSIEQDADLVMFIYRDEYYNRESERPGEADIIVAKHRNGPIGDVTLTFLARYPKFANMYRTPPGAEPPVAASRGDELGGPGASTRSNGSDLPPAAAAGGGSEDDPW